MTTDPTGAFTKVANALKDWPLWLLGAIAASLTVLLLVPEFLALVPPPYQAVVLFATIAAWIASVAKALSLLPSLLASRRAQQVAKTKFIITPVEAQSFWGISKQPDGSYLTQITIRCMVKSRLTEPIHLMKAKVLRPKISGEELPGVLTVQATGSNMHGTAYGSGFFIPPRAALPASATLMFKGMPKQREGKLNVLIEFVDADANASRARMTLTYAASSGPPYEGLLRRIARRFS